MRLRVAHGLAGLNAQQDLLRASVGLRQVMAIVCGDEGNAGFFREPHDLLIDALLHFEALILHLEKEVSLAENVAQAIGGIARTFRIRRSSSDFVHFPAQARRKRDQPVAVLCQ